VDAPAIADDALPAVTVQLPIYNERYVVERLLEAAAALDWPRDRLQIQLLDDSDDETVAIAADVVRRLSETGLHVEQVRRGERSGYKAGALAHGMRSATGEYIAIFDADFVPNPDFLRRTIPVFLGQMRLPHATEPGQVAFVQARWDHLNTDYSLLTRSEALALDGHFGVEQPGRNAAGYPFGFNGSAGVWRRAAIEDPQVGGWQADTLCEDLDLAYRAQMAGWQGVYLMDVAVPAEVPPQLLAFKRQQYRWAKGSVQTLVKQAGNVLRSEWSLRQKVAGLAHLGNYLIHPALLALMLTAVPLQLLDAPPAAPLGALSLASFGPPLLYFVAQRNISGRRWLQRLIVLPILMLFGVGVALNNSMAVWSGLRTKGGDFARTPKFHVEKRRDDWRASDYRLQVSRVTVAELAFALYAFAGVAGAWLNNDLWSAFFMGLYMTGFATIACTDLWQASTARQQSKRHAAMAEPVNMGG
jgi:glycosyltransferase involved in cell wall biosynthesis